MAISAFDVLDGQTSTSSTIVFDSVSVTQGDLLIACCASTAITPPTDGTFTDDAGNTWNHLTAQALTTNWQVATGCMKVAWLIAPQNDAGLVVTFTPNQANAVGAGLIVRCTGHHATTPVPASNGFASAEGTGTTPSATLGATPAATSAVVSFVASQETGTNIAPASGFTEPANGEVTLDGPADITLEVAYDLLSTTTAVGGQTTANAPWGVFGVVIDAAAEGGGATRPAGINRGLINNGLINGGLIR